METSRWSRSRLLACAPVVRTYLDPVSIVVAPSVVAPASVATALAASPEVAHLRAAEVSASAVIDESSPAIGPADGRATLFEIPVVVVDGIVLVAEFVGPATAASRRVVVASPVSVRADDRGHASGRRDWALFRGGGARASSQARAHHRRGRAAKRRRHCHGRRSDGRSLARWASTRACAAGVAPCCVVGGGERRRRFFLVHGKTLGDRMARIRRRRGEKAAFLFVTALVLVVTRQKSSS